MDNEWRDSYTNWYTVNIWQKIWISLKHTPHRQTKIQTKACRVISRTCQCVVLHPPHLQFFFCKVELEEPASTFNCILESIVVIITHLALNGCENGGSNGGISIFTHLWLVEASLCVLYEQVWSSVDVDCCEAWFLKHQLDYFVSHSPVHQYVTEMLSEKLTNEYVLYTE